MQAQAAVKLSAAELAGGIGKAELAVADGGIRREGKVAGRSLSRHVAVAHRPAGERLELRPCDLDRAGEDRAELALSELSRRLDAVVAGQHGLEALNSQRATFGGESEIDRADQIAAKSGLVDGHGEFAVAELRGLTEKLIGQQIEHLGRRRSLLGARHREQRIEIDKARRELGIGRHAVAELEQKLALENLRMAVGVNGEIEVGQLGAVGRGFDGALQFVKRGLVTRRRLGRLLGVVRSGALLRLVGRGGASRAQDQRAVELGLGAESQRRRRRWCRWCCGRDRAAPT